MRGYSSSRDDNSSDSDCMYHCTYPGCNYETNRSAHLKRHERTHTKERPYKCPFCSYCASRSDHLRRHYKIHGKALNSLTIRAQPVQPVQTVPACAIPIQRAIPVYPPHFNNTIDQGTAIFLQFIHKARRESLSSC